MQTDLESTGIAANPKLETKWWTPALAGPVIAAAVVRFTLLAAVIVESETRLLTSPDTKSYLDPGRNLLLHGRFIADGLPALLRTPGYPLFLAIASLAGPAAASAANVILSVLSVLLVWKLGRAIFDDKRIALGAAWILAFEPISITYSVILVSEPLFLVFFLLSMERLAEFLRERRLRVLAAAGLCLTAATFVRPITYYLPVALALGLFFVLARVPGLRWKAPAVLLISVLPWLAAWQIRNKLESGYGGFTSVTDVNLYFFAAADVVSRVEHRPTIDVSQEFGYVCIRDCDEQSYLYQPYLSRNPEQSGWNQAQRLAFLHTEAVRIIRAHPGVYLRGGLENLSRTLFRFGSGTFDRLLYPEDPRLVGPTIEGQLALGWRMLLKDYPSLVVEKLTFGAVTLGLYLFAARGIFLVARGAYRGGIHMPCLWLLLGTSLYFLAVLGVAGGTAADARYRMPLTPILCILAAAGIWRAKITAR